MNQKLLNHSWVSEGMRGERRDRGGREEREWEGRDDRN